jgi:hypothetical protein
MNRALIQMLSKAHDVRLVIDGVPVALTVASQPFSNSSPDIELAEPNMFRLQDGRWNIRFNERAVERRKSMGLGHIHAMLGQQHAFIASAALCSLQKCEMVDSKSEKEFVTEGYKEVGLSVQSNHGEPIVTDETRRRLLIALHDMKDDLALLQADGDNDLAFEKEQEIEKLQQYLNKASFRGHQKRFSDPSERARKRVSVAIARAIADLEAEHPALARHLDNSIHTGQYCRYAPEAEVTWSL